MDMHGKYGDGCKIGTTRPNEESTAAGSSDMYIAGATFATPEDAKSKNEPECGSGVSDPTSKFGSKDAVERIRRERAESQAEYNALLKELHSRPGPPHVPEEATTTGRLYMSGLVGVANNHWPWDGDGNVIEGINEPDLITRKPRGQRLGYRVTKSARKAMIKDPTLYWGIYDYVMANGLVTPVACYRHEIDSPWGMVFRVTMTDSLTVIKKDVEENNIPVNTACGIGVMKWSVVRDYTCFRLNTQLGIRHTSEVKSF